MAMRKPEDLVFPNAAAVDVGASSHWAAVPPHSTDAPVREVGAMTDDLNGLADWLLACGVDVVALESTGVYWIPVYELLEQRGLKVWLVDARQVKYVPGRKSDVQDCQWLQKLMSFALLRAAFRPAAEVCVIRAVARQRDAKVLARHRHRRIKASEQDIVRAFTGNWRDEHLFVLGQALAMYDDIAKHLRECETKLQTLLAERSAASIELGKVPRAGSKARAEFDVRQQLANWAGADLTRIRPGAAQGAQRGRSALKIGRS